MQADKNNSDDFRNFRKNILCSSQNWRHHNAPVWGTQVQFFFSSMLQCECVPMLTMLTYSNMIAQPAKSAGRILAGSQLVFGASCSKLPSSETMFACLYLSLHYDLLTAMHLSTSRLLLIKQQRILLLSLCKCFCCCVKLKCCQHLDLVTGMFGCLYRFRLCSMSDNVPNWSYQHRRRVISQ